MTEKSSEKQGIKLFRGRDAPGLLESGTMRRPEFDADDRAALAADGPRSPHLVTGTHDAVVYRGEGDEGVEVLEFRSCTSFGMKIPGGQLERLRRAGQVADEHGDDWAERRAQIAG
jgi:hypothetical protein